MTTPIFFLYAFGSVVGMLVRNIVRGTEQQRDDAIIMLVVSCAVSGVLVLIEGWIKGCVS